MINIKEFEILAEEIINSSSKSEMKKWIENYRKDQACFINFKPIAGTFKQEGINDFKFVVENTKAHSNRYSLAA